MANLKVLLGCEESQAVTTQLRLMGIDSFSCDVQECSGPNPEWHIKADLLEVIKIGWDAMICFPPCTHLAVSGARWFPEKRKDGRQKQGIDFFMKMANAPIKHIAIENPIGIMSKIYKPPTQIIQPYYFGDEVQKTTCLWLKNLPPLNHVKELDLFHEEITHVGKGDFVIAKSGKKMSKFHADAWGLSPDERYKARSKTFPGIAKNMAQQWGNYLIEKYKL